MGVFVIKVTDPSIYWSHPNLVVDTVNQCRGVEWIVPPVPPYDGKLRKPTIVYSRLVF